VGDNLGEFDHSIHEGDGGKGALAQLAIEGSSLWTLGRAA
jgi:hypothetical protein